MAKQQPEQNTSPETAPKRGQEAQRDKRLCMHLPTCADDVAVGVPGYVRPVVEGHPHNVGTHARLRCREKVERGGRCKQDPYRNLTPFTPRQACKTRVLHAALRNYASQGLTHSREECNALAALQ